MSVFTRRAALRASLATAMTAAICHAPLAGAETTLIVSGWTGPGHHFTALMTGDWPKLVEKESNGRLKVRYLPKAPMTAPQTFDGVRNGLVDISFTTHGLTPGRFLLTKVVEMPFLANDAATLSVAYQRVFERHLAKANEHDGVVPLAMFTPGPGHLMATRKPITAVSDFSGLKLRVPGGMSLELGQAVGASAFVRPATELYEILSSGIVDAAFLPADVFGGWRLEELIKQVTRVPGGFYNASFALIMNPAKYNSLSPEDQAALRRATGEAFSRIAGQASDKADNRGWEIYKKTGGAVHEASPAFVADVKKRFEPVEAAWVKDVAKLGIDGKAVLEDLRREIKNVEAGR